ncbi:uncharacterized protein METZ01_LOCUS415595, partial [marine metagenome]
VIQFTLMLAPCIHEWVTTLMFSSLLVLPRHGMAESSFLAYGCCKRLHQPMCKIVF